MISTFSEPRVFLNKLKNIYSMWDGGYNLFFTTTDGGTLCVKCAKEERTNIMRSMAHEVDDGWRVNGLDSCTDYDPMPEPDDDWDAAPIICDHCGKVLN